MKFLRNFLLLLALGLAGPAGALAQVFDWARVARISESTYVQGFGGVAATTDPAGNTYATQTFQDSIQIGTQTLRTTSESTALVKYSPTGQVLWVQQIDNVAVVEKGLAADPVNGGFFVSAQLPDPAAAATWGGAAVPTGGAPAFYAKCSAAGTLQWVNALPLITELIPIRLGSALVADDLGNCYLIGRMRQAGTVAGVALDTLSQFVLKTTGTGTQQWVRQFNHSYRLTPTGTPWQSLRQLHIAPRAGGGCIVAGRFRSTLFFGPNSGPNSGPALLTSASVDNFVSSIDAAGNLVWIQKVALVPPTSTSTVGTIMAIGTDPVGNCYLTGTGFITNTPTFGLTKYNAAGTLQWTRETNNPRVGYSYGYLVAADGQENVTVVAYTVAAFLTPRVADFVLGTLRLSTLTAVLHFDRLGRPLWATSETYRPNVTTASDMAFMSPLALGLDAQGNIYYSAEIADDTPGRHGAVRLGAHTLVGLGLATTRIGLHHNLLTGRVYLDSNGNGRPDAGEPPFAQPGIVTGSQATRTASETTTEQGFFTCYADSGAYQLQLAQVPLHYTLSQPGAGTYSGRFQGYSNTDSLRHFGLQPIPNQADLRVTLTPYGGARPGFTARQRLTVENVGTSTVASGAATLTLDSRMAYVSSTPGGQLAGQTLTWNYASLAPLARLEFDVLFSLPTNVALGTVLTSTAAAPLAADVVPADNTASAEQTVAGSFDPNGIEVNYQRLTTTQVAAGLPLDYTIRFQNMGTDTAFTVVLSDTLDFRKLNVASLQLLAQSHNCIWSLSGTGLLTVRFLNINLPHRNVDVIRSQGFVRFRVQPKTTLAVGEIIPNHARIVFDYNAPLRTNTAITTVFLPTAALAHHTAAAWDAYPNPATDAVTISAELATAGPVRVELLDVLGRPVRQQTLNAPAGPLRQTLDLRGIVPGVYILRLTPPTGPAASRQVVRQ